MRAGFCKRHWVLLPSFCPAFFFFSDSFKSNLPQKESHEEIVLQKRQYCGAGCQEKTQNAFTWSVIIIVDISVGGANARIAFGWESTFKSAVTADKAFGQGQKLTTFEIDNSVDYVTGLGSQDATASVCKEFKGTWGVEFLLTDPWWLKGILGAAGAKLGAGPYTYTYSSVAGLQNTLASSTIEIGYDLGTTDTDQLLLGCTTNTMSLTANVGELVRVRLDGMFANMSKDTSLTALVSPVEEPFSFAAGSFEIPSGTTIANVQSLEINFNRNVEQVYGLGSRHATAHVAKQREWNIRLTATYEKDAQFWDALLGSTTAPTAAPAEVATAVITITNGLGTTYLRSYVFTFANVRVERGSTTAAVEDIIKQDITLRARTLTSVVATVNTANEP